MKETEKTIQQSKQEKKVNLIKEPKPKVLFEEEKYQPKSHPFKIKNPGWNPFID
jgi:hypothetical protein